MSTNETDTREGAFELRGEVYPFRVSDCGKDLMLIDRLANMSIFDFYELLDDDASRARGSILLTLIATSIRAKHPDWSVARIERLVLDTSLSDIEFIGGPDQEAEPDVPLSPAPATLDAAEPSRSPSNGSSSSSTPEATSPSGTWSEIPL